jgi:hypothetical protein
MIQFFEPDEDIQSLYKPAEISSKAKELFEIQVKLDSSPNGFRPFSNRH